ncbi:MAG: hypothetical protein ACEB74_02045 [Desulfovibrio aminophilus]|uniref:hypothetical protein n=1 Tax=Desulfovibrio aminophilus TaxID=81425 RepID=UPI0039EA6CA0
MAIRKNDDAKINAELLDRYFNEGASSYEAFEFMTDADAILTVFDEEQNRADTMLNHIAQNGTRFTVKEFVRLMDALRMEVPPRLREAVAESEAAPYCGPCCGGEDEFEEATKEDARPVFCFGSPNCPGGSLCGGEVNEEATDF